MHINELLALHRNAVRTSIAIVSEVHAGNLGRPTPCAGWTLGDLLAHMTAQHHGFAAAARGHGGDPAPWLIQPIGPDPASDYTKAAEDVLAAFAEPGVADRRFHLAEFGPTAKFPAAQAIGFHLIDYVVHGWDAARALGLPYQLAPELAEPALRIALAVPDDETRLAPGAAFRPALPTGDDADPLHRILTALGRSPDWPRSGTVADRAGE